MNADPLTSRGEREMSIMDLYPPQEIMLYGGNTKVLVRPNPFDHFTARVYTKVAGTRFKPHWRELNGRNHAVPVRNALRIYHDTYHGRIG